MNIKQILEKFQIFEMAMYENPRKDFGEFRQYVLDNPKAKKTYLIHNDLKIPSDTILHVQKKHNLSLEDWLKALETYDKGNIINTNNGKETRYNGQAVKYCIEHNNTYFGYVIEHFKNGDKFLTTTFMDHPNSIQGWVKQ